MMKDLGDGNMSDEPDLVTRERRNRALSEVAVVVEKIYGSRCTMNEAGCMCCTAWAAFDMVSLLTDSDFLDTP